MDFYVNDNGTWKKPKVIWVKDAGTWKQVKKYFVKDNGTWKQVWNFASLPAGIIFPFNGTTPPSGFTEYTAANGKYILGANGTYSPTSSGGSDRFSASISLSSTGSHLGSSSPTESIDSYSYNVPVGEGAQNSGNHSHTVTVDEPFVPKYSEFKFIKATTDLYFIPQNLILLSSGNVNTTNVSHLAKTDRLLKANTASSDGGSNNYINTNGLTSSGGVHRHSDNDTWKYYSQANGSVNTGSHSHSYDLEIQFHVMRKSLSAYYALSDIDIKDNMIGMWESLTPPEGWQLCDGTNGSPDLRGYFVSLDAEGNELTTTGDNTVSYVVTNIATNNWTHDHIEKAGYTTDMTNWDKPLYHPSESFSHDHGGTKVSSNNSFMSPYYSLTFIQKIPQ